MYTLSGLGGVSIDDITHISKSHQRESHQPTRATPTRARLCTRGVSWRQTRKWRDCPHTNATTIAKCDAFSSVPTSDFGSDAKTGAITGATPLKNITVSKFFTLPIALTYAVALVTVCFGNDQDNSVFDKLTRRDCPLTFSLPYMTEISVVIRQWT